VSLRDVIEAMFAAGWTACGTITTIKKKCFKIFATAFEC